MRLSAFFPARDVGGDAAKVRDRAQDAAGGFSQHGLARALCQGRIAGLNAARKTSPAR